MKEVPMIRRGRKVVIKDTGEKGRVAEITSKGIYTVLIINSNYCRLRKFTDLKKIRKKSNVLPFRKITKVAK